MSGQADWLVVMGVVAGAITLFTWAQWNRRRPRSMVGYGPETRRDLRIDLLRGIAVVFVVINHLGLVSLLQTGTQEAVAMVSGAELFVLLSGAVLGMVYRPQAEAGQLGEIVVRTSARAWTLYRTALAVVLLIFLLSLVPFINGTAVTTFTEQAADDGSRPARVYDLYSNADQLLAYPVNPQILVDLALLRLGPWQINIIGLYVVLLALSPLVLWALSRRWGVAALAVSWSLYALGALTRWQLFPSQFEDSFPFLVWQVLFVTGMVGGYHRREIVAWFRTRAGALVLGLVVLACVALMLFSWNNPYLSSSVDARLSLVPESTFRLVYERFFERTFLDVGRLVNVLVLVVTGYAALSAFWRPVHIVLGWFFIPLGQATLYVFVVHVFFALLLANIPALTAGDVWMNTVINLVVLGVIWTMVKTQFLFGLVPR